MGVAAKEPVELPSFAGIRNDGGTLNLGVIRHSLRVLRGSFSNAPALGKSAWLPHFSQRAL